jgi:hypothetical protein
MADNSPEALQALQERWDAIFAREQARMAAVNQEISASLAMMAGRSIGDDGPDDVRLSREDGPAPGSLAAVQADLQLEDNRAREVREYDEEHPMVFDRVESLRQRLEAATRETTAPNQARQRDQSMGY